MVFQVSSRLLRITTGSELQLPAGSAWNIRLKSASFLFCFCYCKMFDRKTWIFVQLFCRFWFCGHEWMLCILHVMFVAGHATCQKIPAQFVTFFSNFAYWWPSDQSSVSVDRPIKICHVEMINCEKVRLPRQICKFCVSAVSRMESRFFVSRKCCFTPFAFPGRRIARIAIQSSKRYHWQSSHNTRTVHVNWSSDRTVQWTFKQKPKINARKMH